MKTNGTDQKSPGFFKKLGVLSGHIVGVTTQIFSDLSEEELQYLIGRKDFISNDLKKIFTLDDPYINEKEHWRVFYQRCFSLNLNFNDLRIPEKPRVGNWRLLIIASTLSLNKVFQKMRDLFFIDAYLHDLDGNITKNIRTNEKTYAVWVRDSPEVDEEFLGKSVDEVDPDMDFGITVLERLIYELVYFNDTGKHLDMTTITICSGSRTHQDRVIYVYCPDFTNNEVMINWTFTEASDHRKKFGFRRVVA